MPTPPIRPHIVQEIHSIQSSLIETWKSTLNDYTKGMVTADAVIRLDHIIRKEIHALPHGRGTKKEAQYEQFRKYFDLTDEECRNLEDLRGGGGSRLKHESLAHAFYEVELDTLLELLEELVEHIVPEKTIPKSLYSSLQSSIDKTD